MVLVLLIVGVFMVVSAAKNTVTTQGSTTGMIELLQADFTGQDNFLYWLIAMLIIGGIGYIPTLKNFSNVFLALVIVGLILSNGGFFKEFQASIQSTETAPSAQSTSNTQSTLGNLETQGASILSHLQSLTTF
jgi:uncharacterized membrane-anchored protein